MKNSYWRNVASVLTGSALAQLIPVLGSLILARQYAPTEFGIFSVWLGAVSLLSVVLTGRFETALAIESDGEPRRLAVISTLLTVLITACLSSAVLVVIIAVEAEWLTRTTPILMWAAVPTALLIAVAQTWQSWAAAEGNYRELTGMRIAQAATVTLIQIVAGVIFATASALAIAYLVGVLTGLAVSVRLMPLGPLPKERLAASIRRFWYRQRRFPMLSLPADAINTAAGQLPILIVAMRFGVESAGLLAMALQILGAPIGLLGKAVLDVFKRHASTSFRERGECRVDYVRTFKVLMFGSIAFCAVMAVSSEALFALAFGETWRGAGTIAVWLLPLFALRFVASPLSYMVYIAGKQHWDLVWQITLLATTIASLGIPVRQDLALQAYSAGYSILYVIYLVMSYRFSLGKTS